MNPVGAQGKGHNVYHCFFPSEETSGCFSATSVNIVCKLLKDNNKCCTALSFTKGVKLPWDTERDGLVVNVSFFLF